MKIPFFSILLPVYNAQTTLGQTLTSIQQSSFGDWELILVDDGSIDNSREIAQRFARQDPRIHLMARPHQGLVETLNQGLQHCRAPWVARLDADDLMPPQRLEAQKQVIDSDSSLTLIGGQVELFPPEEIRGGLMRYVQWLNSLKTFQEMARDIFVEAPVSHGAATFNREIVKSLGNYRQGPWPEDYDLWLRLWEKGHRFGTTPQTVLKWRHRAGRLTFQDPRYQLEAFRQLKSQTLLKTRLKNKSQVAIAGAGREGKAWAKLLKAHNITITHWIDVNPQKIGSVIQGSPVISYNQLPQMKESLPHILVSVGIKGAREQIRYEFENLGLIETKDFTCVA